jgi:methyl-accepting chemotaxis protein
MQVFSSGQTNAAAAEELTATAIQLSQLSSRLRDEVGRFRVPGSA